MKKKLEAGEPISGINLINDTLGFLSFRGSGTKLIGDTVETRFIASFSNSFRFSLKPLRPFNPAL